jgi:hypothetical protein
MLLAGICLLACGPAPKQEKGRAGTNDSLAEINKRLLIKKDKERQRDAKNKRDSLRLESALNDALRIAGDNLEAKSFNKEYELQPDDSSYSINVQIIVGDLFANKQKYFLLRRHIPWATYLDLFKIADRKIEKVISREQGGMTYMSDTVYDVNGDGAKDFIVHWYPASGCCRRDVYNVYLNLSEKFSQDYEFINPTFSSRERVIRGIGYGHPGEVGLYKYKWNGLQVDTLEFIYPDVNNKCQFIKTKRPEYLPTDKEGIVLKNVPQEYRNIESYEWFESYLTDTDK